MARDRVWTLLLDVGNEQVKPPLGQFQHTSADRHDFFRIVQSINSGSGKPRSDADLKEVFEAIWPTRLGPCIDRLRKQGPTEKKEGRSSEEILAEVLESVRKMDRRYSTLMRAHSTLLTAVMDELDERLPSRKTATMADLTDAYDPDLTLGRLMQAARRVRRPEGESGEDSEPNENT